MIRARFKTTAADPRPINWPIKHPYWISGWAADESFTIIVAYADSEAEVRLNWPEAEEIDATEVGGYVFSDRFPRPDWMHAA